MAAPVYNHDLTDVNLAETTTGWAAYGGGGAGLSASPDLATQGTNCVDKQISASDKGQYFDNGSGITLPAGAHVFVWLFNGTPGLSNTLANKGASILVGTSGSAYCQYHVEGSDTYGAAGRVARCYAVDYSVRNTNGSPPYRTATGSPGANPQVFGGGLVTTAAVKGANVGIDAIRYGTGAYLTAGELLSAGDGSDNPCTFNGFEAQSSSISNRWGLVTSVGGAYELQGKFVIGQNSSKTPTLARFRDSNKTIVFGRATHAASTFNEIIIDHASTRVEWTNINLQTLSTASLGALTVNSANPTVIVTGGTYQGIGITTLRSNCTFNGIAWRGCGQVFANGATMLNSVFAGFEGTANTSALVMTAATDPDGRLDGSSFTKGTAATHAIEFGTATPTTMTLRNVNFSGYNASNNQNDSAIHIKRTSGTVTINIVGGSSPSYRTDGATVNIVAGTVNATVTCRDAVGTAIQNARVFLRAASGGPFPFNASVTIANSGTTATVTHTAHGLSTNDKVVINGASHWQNNGVFSITVTGANTYTYTLPSAPGSSPTGTITSTFVVLEGLTNASGVVTMSRVFPSNQPVTGWARKSSAAPFFKTALVSGTVSSSTGFSATVTMVSDE